MKIRLGYACISDTLGITSSHTITYSNYTKLGQIKGDNKIDTIIKENFYNLEEILKYNICNNILFYRMTSNMIPLATHPLVDYDIFVKYSDNFKRIGSIINNNKLRVDLHLDQFCVINSINDNVVNSSIDMIKFYSHMIDCMGINSYIILHVGSGQGGKANSIKRFKNIFLKLDGDIRKKIILENDDKVFNIMDVMNLCKDINVPCVFDYHHHLCNNDGDKSIKFLPDVFDTWGDGIPKIHFSSPKNSRDFRSHNEYIDITQFISFLNSVKNINRDFDIMIEAKGHDGALFRLVRLLKYKGYQFINDTTFIL